MPFLRNILLLALPFLPVVLAQDAPEPSKANHDDPPTDFQDLLDAVPEDSLHAALHDHLHPKFQDGVFEYDKSAIKAVHGEDPPLATRLVAIAKFELLKREANNATTTTPAQSSPTPESSSPIAPSSTPNTKSSEAGTPTSNVPETSVPPTSLDAAQSSSSAANAPIIIPVHFSTTDSSGSPVVITSSAIAAPSVSVAVPITTTDDSGNAVTTSSAVAAVVVSSTDAQGSVVVTTSPVSRAPPPATTKAPSTNQNGGVDITTTDSLGNTVIFSDVTSGEVVTTTDARGSTFVTTYTPGGGQVKSLALITTSGPNGVQTLTSFAVVAAPSAAGQPAQGSPAPSGTTRQPSLQTGGADTLSRRWGFEAVAAFGGAAGVAWLL